MAPESPAVVPLGVRCASHPEVPCVAICARCGTFLCGACVELRDEAYCASCVALLGHDRPPSRALWGVVALGVLGIINFFVARMLPLFNLLAAGFLWLPVRELRRLQRARASPRGRPRVWAALVLSGLNLLALLYWGAFLAWVFYNFASLKPD